MPLRPCFSAFVDFETRAHQQILILALSCGDLFEHSVIFFRKKYISKNQTCLCVLSWEFLHKSEAWMLPENSDGVAKRKSWKPH